MALNLTGVCREALFEPDVCIHDLLELRTLFNADSGALCVLPQEHRPKSDHLEQCKNGRSDNSWRTGPANRLFERDWAIFDLEPVAHIIDHLTHHDGVVRDS
jgi:hypothetical protein